MPRSARRLLLSLRRFGTDLVGAHVDGFRAILALPLLFALLIGWEFAQHVMEYRIGFFQSREAARAVAEDPSRMALGSFLPARRIASTSTSAAS